jgi:predicted DNA-binding protein
LTDKQIKLLKELANKTGLKTAEHIRRALDKYLEKMK